MTDYRICIEQPDEAGKMETIVAAHRDNLFAALSVYLDTEIEHRETGNHVYLYEQEPETMLNRGYVLIRSSKIDRA